jgi:maleate isomerase
MVKPIRLGMLTPSSNTIVEPMTAAMLAGLDGVSAHFSRFKVTEIGVSQRSDEQFDEASILKAAELLADAKVDVIAWSGTSASWLGFDRDERLCERVTETTGIKACTSVLAFREIFERVGATRIGLVTPYLETVQARIVANLRAAGFNCVAERHCGLQDNFSFAAVDKAQIASMVREVARSGCDAIAIVCTNLRSAGLVEALEAELGMPVYDSIATTVWKSLALAGVPTDTVRGWGGLFDLSPSTVESANRAPRVGDDNSVPRRAEMKKARSESLTAR